MSTPELEHFVQEKYQAIQDAERQREAEAIARQQARLDAALSDVQQRMLELRVDERRAQFTYRQTHYALIHYNGLWAIQQLRNGVEHKIHYQRVGSDFLWHHILLTLVHADHQMPVSR